MQTGRHLISIVAVTGEVYDAHMSASPLRGWEVTCQLLFHTLIPYSNRLVNLRFKEGRP